MSVQFGKCNFDGSPVHPDDLEEARPVLAPLGPDGEGFICKDNFAVLYRALHTTKESRKELQPFTSVSGAVVTFDGRLDNREALEAQIQSGTGQLSTDVEIVAAAYDKWGTESFARLLGDWSVSIWDREAQFLILAKDFIGTRHLYYSIDKDQVTWSTLLDPLVLFSKRPFKLELEYIAGWLSFFPACQLTPYVGVHAVPASSFVKLARGAQQITKYWEFDPQARISYRNDLEYEEHFRAVFADSVRRRLRSDLPILAELSGGMDSSSIVCMADQLIADSLPEAQKLSTISYFNDREPNWNEHPYFTAVEQRRGSRGHHVSLGRQSPFQVEVGIDRFAATPSAMSFEGPLKTGLAECMQSCGSRVLLSGIGGDEVLGGVPTPVPELADLLMRARIQHLVHQLRVWALEKRRPWFHLIFETLRDFFPASLVGIPLHRRPAPWLRKSFTERYWGALTGYEPRLRVFGPLPSFQHNLSTLDALRRQLGCIGSASCPAYEKRYPYLDRSLLEFLFAIPRTQLLRAGQRRSLMRRALRGIVPEEVLNRHRKAFISRGPLEAIASESGRLADLSREMISVSLGIVDPVFFSQVPKRAAKGDEIPVVSYLRTVYAEFWLREAKGRGILDIGEHPVSRPFVSLQSDISRETT